MFFPSFLFCFMVHQDYFTHFKPSQLLGGAKMGEPQEKPPDYPQAELGLSHLWLTVVRWQVILSTKD